MKYLAIILSIFTIALSSIPCDDELAMGEKVTIEQQSSDNHSGDLTDLCSPFCSCVCCATVVIEPFSQQSISYEEMYSKEVNTYNTTIHSSDFLDKILQPPRV
ncbi:MAG TPA: hypothetical protein ENK46_03025 [Flavobacteriia bacterium]|jgi:hypothetical protein|nr:hypothetical protein [Flavobacteriia bacterium]